MHKIDFSLKKLFQTYNITQEALMQALAGLRGNQRVTSPDPEATFEALKKYGFTLADIEK